MAKLLPTFEVDDNGYDDIEVKSERDVVKALAEKLPNDCVVLHGFSLVEDELKSLTTEQGHSSSQIAFLSPNKRSSTCKKDMQVSTNYRYPTMLMPGRTVSVF